MRTAFVTGAQGLLGHWVVRALLERDIRVVVLTRAPRPQSALRVDGLVERCVEVHGDLLDSAALTRVFTAAPVDTVLHLAAQPLTGAAAAAPAATFDANVRGTWLLLEAARAHGVKSVVVTSTDRVLRTDADGNCDEGSPLDPAGPYEASKAAADLIALSYPRSLGLPVAVARCSNVFGGGDLNPSRLVPAASMALLRGQAPVIISDGTPERDYLHAEDVAAAVLALAGALAVGDGVGRAFNVGGGTGRSVLDIVQRLIAVTAADVQPDVRGIRTPQAPLDRHVATPGGLHALTGWAPRLDLDVGLRRTVDWYRDHPDALA